MAIAMAVLLAASLVWAQSDQSGMANQPSNNNGEVTVRGCVSMLNGDYVLTQQDPGNTYQLQPVDKIRLRSYLGKRVEVTGAQMTTLPTSEDAINARMGSASPVTIRLSSIKTISNECESK